VAANPYSAPDSTTAIADRNAATRFEAIHGLSLIHWRVILGISFVTGLGFRLLNPKTSGTMVFLAFIAGIFLGYLIVSWWARRQTNELEWKLPKVREGLPRIGGRAEDGYLFVVGDELVFHSGRLRKGFEQVVIPLREIVEIHANQQALLAVSLRDGQVRFFRVGQPKRWAEALGRCLLLP